MKRESAEKRRRKVREEAARIMLDQHLRDYRRAKDKACHRLGISTRELLPSNMEIADAVDERLQIFGGSALQTLRKKRLRIAVELIEQLSMFSPRLCGADLNGAITRYSPIQLHLFADPPEAIFGFFVEEAIPCEAMEKRIRYRNGRQLNAIGCRFLADDIAIECLLFPALQLREAPCDTANGKLMRRLPLKTVKQVLENFEP